MVFSSASSILMPPGMPNSLFLAIQGQIWGQEDLALYPFKTGRKLGCKGILNNTNLSSAKHVQVVKIDIISL